MGDESRVDDILGEWRERRDRGEDASPEDVMRRHPDLADSLRARFRALSMLEGASGGAPARRSPRLRTLPLDRYTDFKPAGEGGMGIVYWAIDTDLNREVAFKVIRPDVGADEPMTTTPGAPDALSPPKEGSPATQAFETLKARFLQEAWVTGGLSHPGIVPVYELGQTPEGVPYYTMRFVKGKRTLKDAIADATGRGIEDRLALLETFLKVCETISYAHARGVIHRDVKPENVALGEFGEVVVLDWGLAKLRDRPDVAVERWRDHVKAYREAADLRTVASAIGTPGYMAPEAARGDAASMDERSDVYSLGAILFQIVTGRLPHAFETYGEFLEKTLKEDARTAADVDPSVPRGLSDVCAAALSRDRAGRPATAGALVQAVRAWQARRATEVEVDSITHRARAETGAADALLAGSSLRALGKREQLVRKLDQANGEWREILSRAPSHREAQLGVKKIAAMRAAADKKRRRGQAWLVAIGCVLFGAVTEVFNEVQSRAKDRETKANLEAERDRANASAAEARRNLADAYAFLSTTTLSEGFGAGAKVAAAQALATAETEAGWRAFSAAADAWAPRSRWLVPPAGAGPLDARSYAIEAAPFRDGLATIDGAGRLRLWPGDGSPPNPTPEGDVNPAPRPATRRGLAVSGDGSLVAAVDGRGAVRVWRFGATTESKSYATHDGDVTAIALAAAAPVLASAGTDGTIVVRDARSGEIRRTWNVFRDAIPDLALADDGGRLYAAANDAVRRFDVRTGAEEAPIAFVGSRLSLSSASGRLLVAGRGMSLRNLTSGAAIRAWDESALDGEEAALSPAGDRVYTSGPNGRIRAWDATSGRVVGVLEPGPGHMNVMTPKIRVSGDGRLLFALMPYATPTAPGGLRAFDLVTETEAGALAEEGDGFPKVDALARSPDGSTLSWVGTGPDGRRVLRVWDAREVRVVQTADLERGQASTIVYAGDPPAVFVGYHDGSLERRDPAAPSTVRRVEGHSGKFAAFVGPPASGLLYTVGWRDGRIRAWRTADLTRVREVGLEGRHVTWIAPAADGRLFVLHAVVEFRDAERSSTWSDGKVSTWDSAGGWSSRTSDPVGTSRIALAPAGDRLAAGSADRPAEVVVIETTGLSTVARGTALDPTAGVVDPMTAVAFTPDGRWIVTGGGSGPPVLRVWDATTGALRVTLPSRHEQAVVGLEFLEAGATLVSAGDEAVRRRPFSAIVGDAAQRLAEAERATGLRLEGFRFVPLSSTER